MPPSMSSHKGSHKGSHKDSHKCCQQTLSSRGFLGNLLAGCQHLKTIRQQPLCEHLCELTLDGCSKPLLKKPLHQNLFLKNRCTKTETVAPKIPATKLVL